MSVISRREGLWRAIECGLDDDQQLVLPRTYEEHRELYDRIDDVAYLVRGTSPDARIDFVEAGLKLDRLREQHPEIEILEKVYVVRVRLPWNRVEHEWLEDGAVVNANRDDYEILEVYLLVQDIQTGEQELINPLKYQENYQNYEVLTSRYLVSWSKGANVPYVNPEDCYTMLSE